MILIRLIWKRCWGS